MSIKQVVYVDVGDGALTPGFVPLGTGITSQPANEQVTLTTGQSTEILPAAAAGTNARQAMIYSNTAWYVAEGEDASASKFLVPAGVTYVTPTLLAVNGWPESGSPVAYVIAGAR